MGRWCGKIFRDFAGKRCGSSERQQISGVSRVRRNIIVIDGVKFRDFQVGAYKAAEQQGDNKCEDKPIALPINESRHGLCLIAQQREQFNQNPTGADGNWQSIWIAVLTSLSTELKHGLGTSALSLSAL